MNFELEEQMRKPVKSWLENRQDLIKEEFRVPWGYCDVVGCSLNKKGISKRIKLNQRKPIGPQSRVHLLWQIPREKADNSVKVEDLVSIYDGFRGGEKINEDLQYLEERNFIRKSSLGGYQRIDGWYPLQNDIIAIELKLKNVKRALRQAKSHLSYANNSYVALPRPLAERIIRSDREDEFRRNGVGLLGVSPNWCRTMINPTNKEQKEEYYDEILQIHCVERFWRGYIRSN